MPARVLSPAEQARALALRTGRRRATGLLLGVAVVFVAATLAQPHAHWLSWIQATAVASLVGGLADWFAVTALFRRPLGIPIPHTAIVVERKDRFAETLGAFVQESFLTPAAVSERLRSSEAVPRLAHWLADPAHADLIAARMAGAAVSGADLLHDEDVHDLIAATARHRLAGVDLAAWAGRALQRVTDNAYQAPLIDASLAALAGYLTEHGDDLHRRLGTTTPWWLPDAVEDRLARRLLNRSRQVVTEMASDPSHPLRLQLDAGLVRLASDLQTSPELRLRGEELKARLAGQPELRRFAAAVWADTKVQLRYQAAQPGSELRTRLGQFALRVGQRLSDDPALTQSVLHGLDAAAETVLGPSGPELASLVSGTIRRWDATETSERLELLLGPDLQYIRINGTVVGALAGLALHAVSSALHA